MLKVGLTGGIGAGKSTVTNRLAQLGAVVVDADQLAREVVAAGTPGLAAVVEAFGTAVLAGDGTLDRAALGSLVFADDSARRRLGAILHPLIAALGAQRVDAAPPDAVVVHDVPLLVENGLGAGYHLVVVVDAAQDERVRRLVETRGMSEPDARARLSAQADDAARRTAADVWLDNGGPAARTLATVDALWSDRLVPFEANVRLRRRATRPDVVSVVPPDRTWVGQAARLAARVARAAGECAVRVDHIGSTAVPGLATKDIIDLQLVVTELASADAVRGSLEDAGFARADGDWWDDDVLGGPPLSKRVHVACDPGRAVNLHVRDQSGPAWRWQLMFRDWLRANASERAAYAEVKVAAQGVDVETYLDRKGPWVVAALRRAEHWAELTGWRPAP